MSIRIIRLLFGLPLGTFFIIPARIFLFMFCSVNLFISFFITFICLHMHLTFTFITIISKSFIFASFTAHKKIFALPNFYSRACELQCFFLFKSFKPSVFFIICFVAVFTFFSYRLILTIQCTLMCI